MKIKELIELAETSKLSLVEWKTSKDHDGLFGDGGEHDILPILKCAQNMAEALHSVGLDGPTTYMKKVLDALKEWDKLNE